MGRPRKYGSQAERQAAYRARLAAGETASVLVNRRALEGLESGVERLRAAVVAAAGRGVPLARHVQAASAQTVIEKLAAWFEGQAGQ